MAYAESNLISYNNNNNSRQLKTLNSLRNTLHAHAFVLAHNRLICQVSRYRVCEILLVTAHEFLSLSLFTPSHGAVLLMLKNTCTRFLRKLFCTRNFHNMADNYDNTDDVSRRSNFGHVTHVCKFLALNTATFYSVLATCTSRKLAKNHDTHSTNLYTFFCTIFFRVYPFPELENQQNWFSLNNTFTNQFWSKTCFFQFCITAVSISLIQLLIA